MLKIWDKFQPEKMYLHGILEDDSKVYHFRGKKTTKSKKGKGHSEDAHTQKSS
jgi:hypothetical protein